MKRFVSASSVALLVVLVGCGHAPTRMGDVVVIGEADESSDAVAAGCEELGAVEGRAATGLLSFQQAEDIALRDLRSAAARRGATHVRITRRDEPGVTTVVVAGVALHCDDR